MESTPGNLKFTALLTTITAAVGGVIVNLALFFAYDVWWPQGFEGRFDWVAALMAVAAAVALFKYKRSVVQVIAASAVLGLLVSLVRMP